MITYATLPDLSTIDRGPTAIRADQTRMRAWWRSQRRMMDADRVRVLIQLRALRLGEGRERVR